MVKLLTLFLLTSNGNKNVTNEHGFKIDDKIKQITNIDIDFSKKIKTAFQSIHETQLPVDISIEIGGILKKIKEQSKEITKFDELTITFGLLLRRECAVEKIYFDNTDVQNIEKGIWNIILSDKTLTDEIKKTIEYIRHDNSKLFVAINKKINSETKKDTDQTPPFTIKSILELAWGLSLSFSHEESQRTLGGKFYGSIESMLRRFSPEKLDPEKPISGMQQKNEKFVINMTMALSKTARNLGFIRDIHTKFLDSKEKELEKRKKFYSDLSSLTSFSKEGLSAKIGSFIVAGTFASWFNSIKPATTTNASEVVVYPADKIERLEKLLAIAPDGNKTDVFTELFTQVMNSPDAITRQVEQVGFDASLFTAVGIVALSAVTITFKIVQNTMSEKHKHRIKNQQTRYWGNNFIPEASEHLYFFYKDINCLLKNHYGENTQTHMNNEFISCIDEYDNSASRKILPNHLAKISADDKKVLFFIQNQILPHYHIEDEIKHGDEK